MIIGAPSVATNSSAFLCVLCGEYEFFAIKNHVMRFRIVTASRPQTSQPQSDSATCCIVGGGPAGIMLGFLLARAGVDVLVLEKHKDFFRISAATPFIPPPSKSCTSLACSMNCSNSRIRK